MADRSALLFILALLLGCSPSHESLKQKSQEKINDEEQFHLQRTLLQRTLSDIKSTNPENREKAAERLGEIGLVAKDDTVYEQIVPALQLLVFDEHRNTRLNAVRSLGRIGTKAAAAQDDLIKAVRFGDDETRRLATEALIAVQKWDGTSEDP